ncbi:30S ribosomal protein S12 methylthiotransferase RimO [Breznakiella homolactica]|uniref:Ribosomal protein uS12 methylthiotransferase RimO n=1 Tax=Breznakiella homolactica TaxID=2798577 RepID=A0A7T7XNQ5_9SPIR|nr:30S ribosomal protein S12 methylthiotransferase RimO [Breznakiella homolactica]QQO09714.1 30S ribosomal protein S12 methylthiotransferase RimO [Breznakiella homolactica]
MRYFLDPYGCVKNQVDAETMMFILDKSGWLSVADPSEADLIIINSCGFIESAKRESLDAVFSFRGAYPDKKILLAGCLAQRYAAELAGDLPEADMIFGNGDLSLIAEAAEKAMAGPGEPLVPSIDTSGLRDFACFTGERNLLSLPGSAYVKITEGCDNRCSFCAIPNIRGPLRSRPIAAVTDECRTLLDRGIRELCIIGQDLGSYGIDGAAGAFEPGTCRLPELLNTISGLEGRFWVRLLYIHPDNFPLPILDICRRDPRILPYFDIPFQHASEPVLKAMNRRGSAPKYLELIGTIRQALPGAVVRSTFMTGFPGETEEDFRQLLDFQEKARLDWLGVFAYSREEDTPAFGMKPAVAKCVAENRKQQIEDRQIPITEAQMDRFVGKTLDILVEEAVTNEDGLYLGRTAAQAPEVDGATVINADGVLTPGTFIRGRVFSRSGFDLDAAYIHE